MRVREFAHRCLRVAMFMADHPPQLSAKGRQLHLVYGGRASSHSPPAKRFPVASERHLMQHSASAQSLRPRPASAFNRSPSNLQLSPSIRNPCEVFHDRARTALQGRPHSALSIPTSRSAGAWNAFLPVNSPAYRRAPSMKQRNFAARGVLLAYSPSTSIDHLRGPAKVLMRDRSAGRVEHNMPGSPVSFFPEMEHSSARAVATAERAWVMAVSPRRDAVKERVRLAAEGPGGVGVVHQHPPLWTARPINTLSGICI